MIKSMFSSVTGLRNHQTMLNVIGNNIANVNTVGFKSSRVVFSDVYYQTTASATAPVAGGQGGINPMQIGSGSKVGSIDVITTRGSFSPSDRPTDLYISGEGYFVVQDGSGDVNYTRVGNLSFDTDGNLVDSNGNHIMGESGIGLTMAPYDPLTPIGIGDLTNITIANYADYSNVAIGSDGVITGVDNTGTTVTLGQIALASFTNPAGLSQEGSIYMKDTGNSGASIFAPPGSSINGTFVAGGLEMSNVDLSKELTDMIVAQRGFQANSRVITTSDEVLQELVSLKR